MGILSNLVNAGSTLAGTVDSIKTNEKNYNLQVENLAYQKDLQNRIFEREDNAVQRRVADLVSAGLSPTLAAGSSAGAGSVVSTSAPQKKSNFESMMALASVGTALANQQKAITEAENARLSYEQNKMNTDYFKNNGISPIEANMDLSQLLVNKFNRAGNNTLDRILNGIANLFEKQSGSTGIPFSGLPSWSASSPDISFFQCLFNSVTIKFIQSYLLQTLTSHNQRLNESFLWLISSSLNNTCFINKFLFLFNIAKIIRCNKHNHILPT